MNDVRVESGIHGTVSGGVTGHIDSWELRRSVNQVDDMGFGEGHFDATRDARISMRFQVTGEAAPSTTIKSSWGTAYVQLFRGDGTASYDATLRYRDLRHVSSRTSRGAGPRFAFTGHVQGEIG